MGRLWLVLPSLLGLAGLVVAAGACGGGDRQTSVPREEAPSEARLIYLDQWEPVIMEMEEVERLAGFRPLQLEDAPGGFRLEQRFASADAPVVTMSYARGDGDGLLHIVQRKRAPGEAMDRYLIEAVLRGEPVAVDGEAGRYLAAELGVRAFHTLVFERGGITIKIDGFPETLSKELLVDIAASLA